MHPHLIVPRFLLTKEPNPQLLFLVHLDPNLLSLILGELVSEGTKSYAVAKTPAADGVGPTTTWYSGGTRTVHGPDQQDDLEDCLLNGTLDKKAIRVFLSPHGASAEGVRELLPKILPRYVKDEAVVVSLPKYNNNCFPALVKNYPKDLKEDYPTPNKKSKFKPNGKGKEARSTYKSCCWALNTIDDGPRGKLRDSKPEYIQRPEEYDFNNKLAAGLPDEEEDDEGGAEVNTEAINEEEDEDRKILRNAGAHKDILDLLNNIDLLVGVIEIELEVDDDDNDRPWLGRRIYVSSTGMTVHAEATRALPNYQGSSFELAGFTYDPRSHKWRNNDPEASTPTKPKVSRADKLRAAKNKLDECQDTADESKQRLEEAETDAATAVQNLKRARQEHKVAKAERDAMKAKHDQNMDALSVAEEEYKKARRQ